MNRLINNELKQIVWPIKTLIIVVMLIVVFKLVAKPAQNGADQLYSTAYQGEFIEEIAKPAQKLHAESQLFPSIIIAQAILESDWGQSELARSANNLFGVKGQHNAQSVTMETAEYVAGQRITINDQFKKYDNLQQALEDHLLFLKGASYQPVLGARDYKEAAQALQTGGYATDPRYAEKLIELIEQFELHQFDS